MDLLHHTVHHFHAFAFPHLTFAPILVGNKLVRLSNIGYTDPFFILGWGSCGGKKEAEANRQPIEPAPVPQQAQTTRVSRSSTAACGYDVGMDLDNNVGSDDRPPSPQPPGPTAVTYSCQSNDRQAKTIARLTASATTSQLNIFRVLMPGHSTAIRFGTLRSNNNIVYVIKPATHLHLRNGVQAGDIIVSVDGIIAANNAEAISSIGPRSRLVINRLNRSITSTANDIVTTI